MVFMVHCYQGGFPGSFLLLYNLCTRLWRQGVDERHKQVAGSLA